MVLSIGTFRHVVRDRIVLQPPRSVQPDNLSREQIFDGTSEDMPMVGYLGTSNKVIRLWAILAGRSIFAISCNDSVISSSTA